MSKRRKYDVKNKRSFIIILILSVVIVGIFSLFIYKYSKISKIQFAIEPGSVLQDIDKNYISIDDDAILKIRWSGNYYLIYDDEKINLGKKVIVYNEITGSMKLYGTFYEISSDGKITEYKDENVLDNTTKAKFYKLDDREYLLVDSKINSADGSIQTNNYLLVELDKAGNAKLSNNKINLKTISPTILVTSEYTFDIANEILTFGNFKIDLKKIIGSTNQYAPEKNDGGEGGTGTGDGTGTGSGSGTGTGSGSGTGNGSGTGTGTGTGGGLGEGFGTGVGDVINNNDNGNVNDMEEIKDKSKTTSVVRIVEGLTQIDVDYVVYDPYNEYTSLYLEVMQDGAVKNVVYLSKTDTHVTLSDLTPDTDYKLNFIYTTVAKNQVTGESYNVAEYFGVFDLKTKMPEYEISIYKVSTFAGELKCKIDLQDDFDISSVLINMSFDTDEKDPVTKKPIRVSDDLVVPVDEDDLNLGYVYGIFKISNYSFKSDTVIDLTIKSIESSYGKLNINSTYGFRFGR